MNSNKRINKTVKNFFDTIKSIFNLSEDKVLLLRRALDQYCKVLTTRISSRGSHDTIAFLKKFSTLSTKIALGIKFEPLPMTRSDRSGFPLKLSQVKTFLTGDAIDKRIGLSIVNLYKTLTLPPSYNTESITSPCQALGTLGSKWRKFLVKWSKKFSVRTDLYWYKAWRLSNKAGPHGPATLTSMLDLVSVRKDERVWKALKEYLSQTDVDLLMELDSQLRGINLEDYPSNLSTGRLAFLQEGGGKTRVIAIGDYLTQQALTPLFKEEMRLLKSIPQDGTYDQQNSVKRITEVMKDRKKPIYCFDLSNATDRFPLYLQKDVVGALFNQNIGEAWGNLLTDRTFLSRENIVEYAVGQPMGFLSSWSTFALTHHAFIQYCASRVGIIPFCDYVILGDDVAIFNEKVANRYSKLMEHLGVKINYQKSMVWVPGDRSYPYAEFAKRIIWDGHDISPIPIDLLEAYWKKPITEFYSLWFVLRSFGIDIKGPATNKLVALQVPKVRAKLIILSSAPDILLGRLRREHSLTPYEGVGEGPWLGLDLTLIPLALSELLDKEFEDRLMLIIDVLEQSKAYAEVLQKIFNLQGRALVKSSTAQLLNLIPFEAKQPLPSVIKQKRFELIRLKTICINARYYDGAEFAELRDLWEKLSQCTDDIYCPLQTKRSKVSEIQSSIVLKLHDSLKDGFVIHLGE